MVYLLPLRFNEDREVIDFLLVPVVGACVHLPPPPPNQLVCVRTEKGFAGTLFQAITVTGTITVEQGEERVFIVDGTASVSFGYNLRVSAVRAYDGPKP